MGLQELMDERRRRRCESSLLEFFYAAWRVLEPSTELVKSWHYELICAYLELATFGRFKQQFPEALGLICNVPPRSGKSSLISVAWPVWSWIHRPSLRFLCASYAEQLAAEHSLKRRNLIQSRWYQHRWGDRFQLSSDRNRISDFGNDKTGHMIGTSVTGVSTGFGADICVGDDLLAQDDAFSEAARTMTNRWLDGTWSTKLNDPATGIFVHVSQRLAEDDPVGHLLSTQPGRWVHLKIPLECEADTTYEFPEVVR